MSQNKISLIVVATANYISLLEAVLGSADKYFLVGHDVEYCVLTDHPKKARKITKNLRRKSRVLKVEHKPFPYATLMRYHYFKEHKKNIDGDYVYYVDADCRFFSEVGDEILGELVATRHCGFVNERGTYETNPESTAYIPDSEGEGYYVGSFQGGGREGFWRAVDVISKRIDEDNENGFTAVWWDESHWNRYLVDCPPTKILSPSYHFPESNGNIIKKWLGMDLFFPPKIIALDKDHHEMRGTFNFEAAQKYELDSNIKWVDEAYDEMWSAIDAAVESGKARHHCNEFFKGDEVWMDEFMASVAGKTNLEVSPGICGALPLWKHVLGPSLVAIDPLIEKYHEYLESKGRSWFDGIVRSTSCAEDHLPLLDKEVDGFIFWRNGINHYADPFKSIETVSKYAAPGCTLFFWAEIEHDHVPDAGHRNVTNNPQEVEDAILAQGWELLYHTPQFDVRGV